MSVPTTASSRFSIKGKQIKGKLLFKTPEGQRRFNEVQNLITAFWL